MYLGEIVEMGPAGAIARRPLMPYTQALMPAVPSIGDHKRAIALSGEIPSPVNPPPGCRFHTRCPYAIADCSRGRPELQEIEAGHWAASIRISPHQPEIGRS
jgi:oligopeptide/dipeptide ABC transporter ATP-binding protein